MSKKIVIKYGGHALDDESLNNVFAKDIALLSEEGFEFIVVHGGGPQINNLLSLLNIESSFANGLRITTPEILDIAEMVLCGKVNKAIVRLLKKNGVNAAGISGEDGSLFIAEQKDPALGRVGNIIKTSPEIITSLISNGFVPVVAPIALDAKNEPLNINADTSAGAIAGAVKADSFILVSDVPGVLDKTGKLIPELSISEINLLIKDGTIYGGMLPKLEACINAIKKNSKNAIILNGKQPGSLKRYLKNGEPLGTLITA